MSTPLAWNATCASSSGWKASLDCVWGTSQGRCYCRRDRAAPTWAEGVRRLVEEDFPQAQRITLVLDNLSTHTGASLYKTFAPEKARALLGKLAECEFSVLARQCLDRRIADIDTLRHEVSAWTEQRNQTSRPVEWRFTTDDACIKLRHLYQKIKD